ncbi:cyclic nucleotide-binding domain protein [delta proteobacterium NaphS2]|nr:cyclic nucleotide-binding domain protein [delta proteobacterium NaphS2]
MISDLEIISKTLIFEGLPAQYLEKIRDVAVSKKYLKGETIFMEQDEGNGFYLVAEGQVKIFKVSVSGKEQILHVFGPGEPFGEVPVFSGRRFPANAEAIQASRLLFFPRSAFLDLITSHPSLALNMLAVLSMRLRQFTQQIENLSLKEVPARLAAYLLYLSTEQGREEFVALDISKGQLASLLGTIPETLSRIFGRMGKQGLIEMEDRKIRLLDREALESLAVEGKKMD